MDALRIDPLGFIDPELKQAATACSQAAVQLSEGLAGHGQHAAAATQFTGGFGGIVSFALAGTHENRLRFVNDLRVITSAVSLGHDETLVAYEQYPDGASAAFAPVFQEHGLIRLAIGLESREDLIADLDASLTTAYGPAR